MKEFGDRRSMEIDTRPTRAQLGKSEVSPQPAERKLAAPAMNNFEHVRRNIRTHSQGIFEPPATEQARPPLDTAPEARDLPAHTVCGHLSRSYFDSVHEAYPILHWSTFESEVEQLYTSRNFQGASRGWIGLFHAVLACGCLNLKPSSIRSRSDGARFYDIASQSLNPWPQKPDIVHVRLLFLLSIYATESGMQSAGSMWLASAIKVAQDLGIHSDDENPPFVESELRRRIWWAIYVRERSVTTRHQRRCSTDNV